MTHPTQQAAVTQLTLRTTVTHLTLWVTTTDLKLWTTMIKFSATEQKQTAHSMLNNKTTAN